ncbi:peptidyl-prolyl cis-trans isomerase CYP59 [Cucumis melo var. makuwa]|uniref:Peptidyl-prolyl cis-trans isomerase n=1 Tax=Cucumis melo var. makuwa TaxID=1194695 RepID=A0A5A7U5E3_CUCMM|nr:peptidyl-prolyl cis-trans isomerase CYP59 [Cucumis melo var. makuwa]TYK02682.1 peptidyl-prolyl cis-trans isomerase CYP59 [Cucumis melo var. makuwa]
MSVLIVTSLGDIVIDLHTDMCPLTSKNFLKLCKIKYYNGCLFHTIQKDFTAQTGDPTGTGTGGDSIYKFLYGDQARFFSDEIRLDLKHSKTGTVAMASAGENLNASQFYFTLRDDLEYLDGKHTVFGEVAEGLDTLTRINEAYADEKGRPYKNIRIKHTYILDDPFDDPPQLAELIPDSSPDGKPKDEVVDEVRLEDDWVPLDEQLGPEELEEVFRAKEAHSRAVVLETIGDIPDAEIKPPDNVLFVCKLNPVTEDEDLHTIFSRFGTVLSAEVIRDYKTGDSLCYAFIEFETKEACEQAYFKMDNALIDDRRIHVDFSQSVAKLWSQYRRKDYTADKGRGCFKCGAPDHMARDCTGGSTKFILKDDNVQHGGDESRKERRRRDHDHDRHVEMPNARNQSPTGRERYGEKKGASDRNESNDRNRFRGREMHRENKDRQSRGDRDDFEDRRDHERQRKRQNERDDHKKKELDYKKRSLNDRDAYGNRDYEANRNRSGREYSDRSEKRKDEEFYGRRHADKSSHEEKRQDIREYRKDERGYGKRNFDSEKAEIKDGPHYKKRYTDDDGYKDRRDDGYKERREEREPRRRSREEYKER